MRRWVLLPAFFLASVATAMATPEAATWHRQTLVGENVSCFFRLVTVRRYPGTYYEYGETLRVQSVRKSDFRVMEDSLLRVADYTQDANTGVWTVHDTRLPPLDMGGYLRRHGVYLTFSEAIGRRLVVDSSGVAEVFEDGRSQLLSRKELERQVSTLGEQPRIAGIEFTELKERDGHQKFYYLRLQSNDAAIDDDWSEDLLLIPGDRFH